MSMSRRTFLKVALRGTAAMSVAALGGTVYTTRVEPVALEVTRLTVRLPNLPPQLAGVTLAQVSDVHFGMWMKYDYALSVAEKVNELNPDFVAVTGDFVSRIDPGTPDEISGWLRTFNAPVYASLGNHDHWTDANIVSEAVQNGGAALLRNANAAFERDGQTLFIAGVDDIWERQQDLDAALNGVPQDGAVILLAHEPDYADAVREDGRVGLQLSGHSHGGQVRLPLVGAPLLPYLGTKYSIGMYELGAMRVYVNRGVGMIAPYVRLGCPPEITLITLE
ncbi:MAG: metallophosphoesterase [Anaerolineae bacterium]